VKNLTYPHGSYYQPSALTDDTATTTRTIPFDYGFQFALKGVPHNKVQDVVEISMQGVFVAVAVGYSLVPDEKKTPRTFPPVIDQQTTPSNPVLVPFFPSTFPTDQFNGFLVAGTPDSEITILGPTNTLANIILPLTSPSGATQNTSRIGADGTVVVKLVTPVTVGSIFRVWDKTNNLLSETFEVNFPLTTPGIGPHHVTRRLPSAGETSVDVYGLPGDTVSVFLLKSTADTVSRVKRKETAPNGTVTEFDTFILAEDKISFGQRTGRAPVTLDQPLAPGDVLLVRTEQDGIDPFSMFTVPRPRFSTLTLGALAAGLESVGTDLSCGFRPNPNVVSLLTADIPLDKLTPGTLDKAFESCCLGADEVSFLYSIDVVSTGRELQNKAIHNVAGLGIANGDRPFRPFAKPISLAPRSSIRIQIEEISGPPGTLHIVLQGYKMLGTGRIPG
jgi:hypothetical protein